MNSEFGEDIWIQENIALPEHGFYLDLGCAWPVRYNNTAFLRAKWWAGINVDGNPRYEREWVGVAPFTCCVIGDGKPVLFDAEGVPELSRVGSGQEIPTRRLDDLLRFSSAVDFISCDLEGHEFAALSTFDWKHRPKMIVSEYNTHGIGEDYRVRDMLLALGYSVVHQTKANLIFVLP